MSSPPPPSFNPHSTESLIASSSRQPCSHSPPDRTKNEASSARFESTHFLPDCDQFDKPLNRLLLTSHCRVRSPFLPVTFAALFLLGGTRCGFGERDRLRGSPAEQGTPPLASAKISRFWPKQLFWCLISPC